MSKVQSRAGSSEFNPALPEKPGVPLLCATSAFSVSLWLIIAPENDHKDTKNTEVAQREQLSQLLFGQSQFNPQVVSFVATTQVKLEL